MEMTVTFLPQEYQLASRFKYIRRRHQKRRLESCHLFLLVATCPKVATNLSNSSSCNKSVKGSLVADCHFQTCYNFSKELVACLWITSFDSQLATSLLTTCNRPDVKKLSQAMRTHPDICLSITSV